MCSFNEPYALSADAVFLRGRCILSANAVYLYSVVAVYLYSANAAFLAWSLYIYIARALHS